MSEASNVSRRHAYPVIQTNSGAARAGERRDYPGPDDGAPPSGKARL
jgi:hypothetical protein